MNITEPLDNTRRCREKNVCGLLLADHTAACSTIGYHRHSNSWSSCYVKECYAVYIIITI